IQHLHHALVVRRLHLLDGRKDTHHCIVHPNVDRAEGFFHAVRGLFYRVSIRNMGWDSQRLAAKLFAFLARSLQSLWVPGKQSDSRSTLRECMGDSSPEPGRSSCHHDNFTCVHVHTSALPNTALPAPRFLIGVMHITTKRGSHASKVWMRMSDGSSRRFRTSRSNRRCNESGRLGASD